MTKEAGSNRSSGAAADAGKESPAKAIDESMIVLRMHECDGPILNHDQLRRAIYLTMQSHKTPGLQVWTGQAGVGKTVAAEQLAYECNERADRQQANAFRAQYFLTGGEVVRGSQRGMKRGVYCAYEQLVGELSTSELRQKSEQGLAVEVVEEARLRNVQLIIVDEAGTKTEDEIRGLALICDVARERHWALTILLVGMDDLAGKTSRLPVIQSRVRLRVLFEPWDKEECMAYVTSRSPQLTDLASRDARCMGDVLDALMTETEGRMREMQSLLPEIDARLSTRSGGKRCDARTAVKETLDWRRTEMAAALVQSNEYSVRRATRASFV